MVESQGRSQVWTVRAAMGLVGMGVLMLTAGSSPAQAADTETRDFTISVDGRHAGFYRMTLRQQADGSIAMTGDADVRVSYLVYRYRYQYQGTEVWKDGRLLQLRSKSNDNGAAYQVDARAEGDDLRVRVNGVERTTRWDVWTTTYWRLPPPKYRNQAVPLLDADTGKDIAAVLQYRGEQQIAVAGRLMNCAHYHVGGGGLAVDLWYDSQERLVRQVSVENGSHQTVLEQMRPGH